MVLLLLLAEEVLINRLRIIDILSGQLIGMFILVTGSIILASGVHHFPLEITHYLGVIPILVGVKGLWHNVFNSSEPIDTPKINNRGWQSSLTVAGLTLASGSDNLAVYIPFFQHEKLVNLILITMIFIPLTAIWVLVAMWIANLQFIKVVITSHMAKIVPIIFIIIGVIILIK